MTTCEREGATLLLWGKGAEGHGAITTAPYRCHSWRCRRCSWGVARDDYRRVEAGALSKTWWLYIVLTFNPADWADPWKAYADAGRLWDKRLKRRLEREWGRLDYLQTWERTRRQWPHVNILLRSDALREHVSHMKHKRRKITEGNHGRGRMAHWTAWRNWLKVAAVESGFGYRTWVEIVDEPRGMSAYLCKVAAEFSASAFKEGDQRPLGAPEHFRRIRASRGLLPPRTRVVWQELPATRTDPARSRLVNRPLDAPSDWTGVLSPHPITSFDKRAPGWHDVADAWEYQERAKRKRAREG